MSIITNLPTKENTNVQDVKTFFDNYFVAPVSFPANEIDSTVAFFTKRGFDHSSAASTTIVLLNQARIDGVSVFQLLDMLKSLTDVQLGQVVAQILNGYREKTSILGYKVSTVENSYEARNILI
jgi:hypothetical protein